MRLTSRKRRHFRSASQSEIAFHVDPLLADGRQLAVLDLFAGIGGLSAGFAEAGFSVTGVDSEALAEKVYSDAGFGRAVTANLSTGIFTADVPVVIGGPPCRPWSAVNLKRRRTAHEDHGLLTKFVEHIEAIRPVIFVMENVPALHNDPIYTDGMTGLEGIGYDVDSRILHYNRFGAATRRRRLFTVGVHNSRVGAHSFFQLLIKHERPHRTVRDAIHHLRDVPRGAVPDHDWSELRSIANYRERYSSGQYGWARLNYDLPAPSFGSVAKTYILHPEAGLDGYPERVLSVREVLAIMGFDSSVQFPAGAPRAKRYQMAANAVSPEVSRAVASTVRVLLTGSESPTRHAEQ